MPCTLLKSEKQFNQLFYNWKPNDSDTQDAIESFGFIFMSRQRNEQENCIKIEIMKFTRKAYLSTDDFFSQGKQQRLHITVKADNHFFAKYKEDTGNMNSPYIFIWISVRTEET